MMIEYKRRLTLQDSAAVVGRLMSAFTTLYGVDSQFFLRDGTVIYHDKQGEIVYKVEKDELVLMRPAEIVRATPSRIIIAYKSEGSAITEFFNVLPPSSFSEDYKGIAMPELWFTHEP